MQRVGGVQKKRRRAGAGKCRGDFSPDQPGFAQPGDHHAALARIEPLDGLLETRCRAARSAPRSLLLRFAERASRHQATIVRCFGCGSLQPAPRFGTPRSASRVSAISSRRRPIRAPSAESALIFSSSGRNLSSGSAFVPSESAFAGIVVNFEKYAVNSRRHSRARQRLDEFRLPAAGLPFSARQLHRMRHVENHRVSQSSS